MAIVWKAQDSRQSSAPSVFCLRRMICLWHILRESMEADEGEELEAVDGILQVREGGEDGGGGGIGRAVGDGDLPYLLGGDGMMMAAGIGKGRRGQGGRLA